MFSLVHPFSRDLGRQRSAQKLERRMCSRGTRRLLVISKRERLLIWFWALIVLLQIFALSQRTGAQGLTGSIKGTVSATSGDASARPELLPGASLILVNRDVSSAVFKTVSDETGSFAFLELPASSYILAVEANGLPRATKEIHLTSGATIVVEIILTATVSESVTIRDEEGLLSTGETVTSNTVRADKMEQLPLRADNYQGALPLTPSIIRDVRGADHIKGTRAGESAYT